jgi:glutamyl-tRNA reductase
MTVSPSGSPLPRWSSGVPPAPDTARHAALLVAAPASGAAAALPAQAAALEATLPAGWHVGTAVHDGPPAITDALRALTADGVGDVVVVPMHPHFSPGTTGAITRDLYEVLQREGCHLTVAVRTTWYDDAGYVNALARRIAERVTAHDVRPEEMHLRFRVDGPVGMDGGERQTYERHVRRTVELVVARLGWPADWWSLEDEGMVAASCGAPATGGRSTDARRVLVCAIPFLGGSLATKAERIQSCPALGTQEPFIAALRNLVLHGAHAAPSGERAPAPLLTIAARPTPTRNEPLSLVMVGASLPNRLRAGGGPAMRYSHPGAFARVRKSRKALHAFLQWTRGEGLAAEAFVWDTCQRVEFYGWLAEGVDVADRECAIARIRHQLYGAEPEGLEVNVLFGQEARHHLLRTACGLNSGLPGDADVVAQLETALRIASCGQAAGPRAAQLVKEAAEAAQEACATTPWGRFSTGYCLAALSRLRDLGIAPFAHGRHVVIGGSTTSRSILSALAGQFDVPQDQLTLVYRDHHGQMKLLRTAIGHGRRLRVHDYAEPGVVAAIGDADVVFFGIDQPEPVLDPGLLRGLRDFSARPLAIIDFNSFGSLVRAAAPEGVTVWTAADLERAVSAYADEIYAHPAFAGAVEDVEEWIERRLAPAEVAT